MARNKSRSSCLIILGGEIPDQELVRQAARKCREIICADGAVVSARELGLPPNFVVGDMDSLPKRIPGAPRAVFWCDFDPERSDFQKCLDFASGRGFSRAYITGALGGRLDHAIINLAVAERVPQALDLVLLDRGMGVLLGPGIHAPRLAQGLVFSVLPAPKAVVSLSGCAYPLRKAALERSSRGLGNRASGNGVKLTIHQGRIWFFWGFK